MAEAQQFSAVGGIPDVSRREWNPNTNIGYRHNFVSLRKNIDRVVFLCYLKFLQFSLCDLRLITQTLLIM